MDVARILTTSRIYKTAMAIMVTIVAIALSYNFFSALDRHKYYHRIVSEEITEPVHVNGEIHTMTVVERYMPRGCTVSINRLIVGADGEVRYSQVVPGIVEGNGTTALLKTIKLPDTIQPGLYKLEIRVNMMCDQEVDKVTTPKPVPFEVLPN